MGNEELIGQLHKVIEKYLNGQGFELVELVYRFEGQDMVLRIMATIRMAV